MVNPIILIALLMVPGIAVECTTIQDGVLEYPSGHYLEGQLLETGYDIYGFNYQAHIFKGQYLNYYLGAYGYPPYNGEEDYLSQNPGASWLFWYYEGIDVLFKWNDADTSNKDCDGDGLLDEHYMEKGSGAWWTEKWWIRDDEGKLETTYSAKYIVVPEDAYRCGYLDQWWCDSDGEQIGLYVYPYYALIKEDYKNYNSHSHWLWRSPTSSGLGKF